MKNSSFFSLNVPDFVKAAALAGLAIVVSSLTQAFAATPPHLPTGPEFVATLKLAGYTAGLYLLKNLVSNQGGVPFKKDEKPTSFFTGAKQ